MRSRHHVRRILLLLVLVPALALLAAACGQADDELDGGSDGAGSPVPTAPSATPTPGASPTAPASDDPLAGTEWTLAMLAGEPALAAALVTARFADGQLAGDGGCNGYGGAYTTTGETLTIGPLVRTEMYCETPTGVMDQEDAFLAALETTAGFRLADDGATLELLDAGGASLATLARDEVVAQDPALLPGTRWALSTVAGDGFPMDLSASLVFDAAGARFSGTAICRDFEGEYLAPAGTDDFSVPALAMTQEECLAPQATRALEAQVIDALSSTRDYAVDLDAGTLELRSARAGALVFDLLDEGTEPPMSEPTLWILQSMTESDGAETPPIVGSEITLQLERDALQAGVPMKAAGSAGCNRYATTLTWANDALTVAPPAATRMLCSAPEGVMEQESAYLETLAAVTSYAIEADVLRLATPDGRTLVFMEKQDA